MSRICLSTCGKFIECWNNGNKIRTCSIQVFGFWDAIGDALDYLRKWTGAEPEIDRELKAKMNAADAAYSQLAFGSEWR